MALVLAPARRCQYGGDAWAKEDTPLMDVVVGPLVWLIHTVINIFIWLLVAGAVLSWLVALNVVNTRNRFVSMVGEFLYRVTEPALRPIRRLLPSLGGIDLSPLVLILGLLFLQQVITRLYVSALS
jgi:YggT family protein